MIGAAHRRRRPAQGRWRLLAVVLTLAGVGCLLLWADTTSATPVSTQEASPRPAPSVPATATPTSEPAAPEPANQEPGVAPATTVVGSHHPAHLAIPRIGVSTDLIGLGLQPDGTVEVPQQPQQAGWFRLGTPPGDLGSAVLLGHVDSVDGPAVFAELADLEAGDRIVIRRKDGAEVTFAVRTVTTYANEDFPAQLVYGSHGRRELNLVTCGGDYDADRGGYQANVVVNAHQVDVP